jgi:hypothetical protein
MEKESNKIKPEQLEKILDQQQKLSNLLKNIGVMESNKAHAIEQVKELNSEVEVFKAELETEYGPINIDLKDGSYTEVEKKEEEKEEEK